ncbi:outer membrane protein assembly factor BamB family protein [Vibrio atypicus]|uniref:outer membrane protein assembly factor BamB family protein n=1 Tax=Vibrio atypicus TaxID=558271 RepID=UPI003736996A
MKLHIGMALVISFVLSLFGQATAAESGDYLGSLKSQGQIWSSPKIDGELVYFGSDDGNFYAFNRKTKAKEWQFTTAGKVRSIAAFAQNLVFFSSDDGLLYALSKESGVLVWKFNLDDKNIERLLPVNRSPWDYDYSKSSPVIDGDTLYIGSANHHLYALSSKTGELKWSFKAQDRIRSTATFNHESVFVSSWDGNTYALNKETGALLWQHASNKRIVSDPALIGDKIIIGSRDTVIYALDTKQGNVQWQYQFGNGSWVESSAIRGENDNVFYIGSSDNKQLLKFDANTGKRIWEFITWGWTWGTPVYDNGVVYIGSTGAKSYWTTVKKGFFAVDAMTGEQRWQYKPKQIENYVDGGVYGSVAVDEDAVYVPDLDGSIHIFKK